MVKKEVKKPDNHCMKLELGEDWSSSDFKKAVADKVGTRVKASALRYGFFEDED